MKRIVTIHLILRMAPIALLLALLLTGFVRGAESEWSLRICCYLLAASVLYLSYPLSREDFVNSSYFAVCISVYYLVFNFLVSGREMLEYFFLIPTALFILPILFVTIHMKYREPAALFRKDAQWCCAEEDSRTVYSAIVLLMVILTLVLSGKNASPSVFCVLAFVLFVLDVVLHYKAYTGYTMMIGHKKERRIQTIMITNGHGPNLYPEIEEDILQKSYSRVEQVMREKKPFLKEKFTLEEMSDILRINKVYISRSVNKYTGKNFRQFVNWHRVLYAAEVMRDDPWLRVLEVAFMSGFHSQVTFNLAFRMFLNETPSDMLARLRLTAHRRKVSRNVEEEAPDKEAPSSQDGQK